ncbi:hypothetical protein Tco_0424895 [Tanacetum coccineum]
MVEGLGIRGLWEWVERESCGRLDETWRVDMRRKWGSVVYITHEDDWTYICTLVHCRWGRALSHSNGVGGGVKWTWGMRGESSSTGMVSEQRGVCRSEGDNYENEIGDGCYEWRFGAVLEVMSILGT